MTGILRRFGAARRNARTPRDEPDGQRGEPRRGPYVTVSAAAARVALAATALVGIVYAVVALAVVVIVTNNLTAQVDDRLRHTLANPLAPPDSSRPFNPPSPDRPFGSPILVWDVRADGTVVTQNTSNIELPAAYRHVSGPQTVSLGGVSVRIAGAPFGDDYVVVGQTMDNVTQTQGILIPAEIGIGAGLLIVVFLGAVAIGRRVALPIEQARQRQLEFTADASHELRTPLSVIEAQTSLALAHERSPDWYRKAFERVDAESRRIRRLVEDLLWLARFDATRGQPDAEPVDVGVLAAQAADRFGIVAETRHLRLSVHEQPGGNVVTVPPDWLDRLLGVLLDNACRYSPEGGSIDVSVGGDARRVRLTVDDSGPGIPPDERDRIFDRFHRASNKPGGAGLGLAIGDAIVRATNGRWQIAGSPAGGASIAVSWPRSVPGQPETRGERERREAAQPAPAERGAD